MHTQILHSLTTIQQSIRIRISARMYGSPPSISNGKGDATQFVGFNSSSERGERDHTCRVKATPKNINAVSKIGPMSSPFWFFFERDLLENPLGWLCVEVFLDNKATMGMLRHTMLSNASVAMHARSTHAYDIANFTTMMETLIVATRSEGLISYSV